MMNGLRSAFSSMPEKFEQAGYDFNSFRRVFVGGTLAIWILVIAIYVIYNEPHTVAAALVAFTSATMVTLVLLPLSVAQANRSRRKDQDD